MWKSVHLKVMWKSFITALFFYHGGIFITPTFYRTDSPYTVGYIIFIIFVSSQRMEASMNIFSNFIEI